MNQSSVCCKDTHLITPTLTMRKGKMTCCLTSPARLSLRSACSLPYGARTPARGGYSGSESPRRLRSGDNASLFGRKTTLLRVKASEPCGDPALPLKSVPFCSAYLPISEKSKQSLRYVCFCYNIW